MLIGEICFIFFSLDTKAEAVEVLQKKRHIVPGVYNMQKSKGRTTEQSKLLNTNEHNNALASGFMAINDRFEVKKEKFCGEISSLRRRIFDGTEGLDDSDIEYLDQEINGSDAESDLEFEAIIPQPVIAAVVKSEDENDSDVSQPQLQNSVSSSTNEADAENQTQANNSVSDVNENDDVNIAILSGNIAVTKTPADDYVYPDYGAAIRRAIAQLLTAWNSTPIFSNTQIYDKRFIGVLLKEVCDNELAGMAMDDKRILFIKKLFQHRVNSSKCDVETRLSSFDKIVAERCVRAEKKKPAKTTP